MDAEKVYERLGRIEAGLAEHMRRSEALEASVELLRADVKPLQAHVAAWAGVAKALGVAGGLAGIAGALWKMIG